MVRMLATGTQFGVLFFDCNTGYPTTFGWWLIDEGGTCKKPSGIECGLRPVFKLIPEVKILSGQGTEDDPYEIGL